MNERQLDLDFRSTGRLLSRLSVLAAFLSCTLNCVFSQVARRIGTIVDYGPMVDWLSMAVVIAGVVLGIGGLVAGLRRRSPDTAVIGSIGLAANLIIIFVVVWYFVVVRPTVNQP